jgi:hypothetical protein
MLGSPRVAAELAASQEGLSSMKSVSQSCNHTNQGYEGAALWSSKAEENPPLLLFVGPSIASSGCEKGYGIETDFSRCLPI